MVSILRSPTISGEKRKLSTRRPRPKDSEPATAVPSEVVASETPVVDAGAVPTSVAPQVADLVEQARQSVLAQFKEEAEAARELGRQRGLREGHQAGTEEAKQNFAAEFARVRSITDQLQQALVSGNPGVEDMAVEIAFEAVCKVLGNAAVTREGVQAMVHQAAAQVRSGERVVVRLHAADLSLLREAGALETTLPAGSLVSWVADKHVALGGCVIETDGGELDARLETQMERLRSVLVAARRSAADLK